MRTNQVGAANVWMPQLMQNLEGEESLYGKGLSIAVAGSDTVLGCCVIGRDVYRRP